ncbi:hypothetical protein T07_12333, partial [Trichinella nelsoni]
LLSKTLLTLYFTVFSTKWLIICVVSDCFPNFKPTSFHENLNDSAHSRNT